MTMHQIAAAVPFRTIREVRGFSKLQTVDRAKCTNLRIRIALLSLEAPAFPLSPERARVDAELRGSLLQRRRLGECAPDLLALELLEGTSRRYGRRTRRCDHVVRKLRRGDHR